MATRQDTSYDIFISHSSRDKAVADAVCAALEQAGTRCWIAPRDIRPGEDWGASIVEGIRNSRAMVLVFSSNTNASGHIPREVEQAVKQGVTVIPFRIEQVVPKGSLDYNLSSVHWLDALTPPLENHIGRLVNTVTGFLNQGDRPAPRVVAPPPVPPSAPPSAPPSTQATRVGGARGWLVPVSAVAVIGGLAVGGYAFFSERGATPPSAVTAPEPQRAASPASGASPPSAPESASPSAPPALASPSVVPVPSGAATSGARPAAREPSAPAAAAGAVPLAAAAPATVAAEPARQDAPARPSPEASGVEASVAPTPVDAGLAVELRQLRRRLLQLQARRDVALGTILSLEQQQKAAGAGLRRDIALARQTVLFQLEDAEASLAARSSSEASQALDMAERQLETLERFVGR